MKAEILKGVDDYLFSHMVEELKTHYVKATKINKGAFNYSFFNRSLIDDKFSARLVTVPSQETIQFIKPYLDEYTEMIKRRELIQCYLLQFMNQTERVQEVTWLLPDSINEYLFKHLHEPTLVKSIIPSPLVQLFRDKTEYNMIKQQEVFLTMGL